MMDILHTSCCGVYEIDGIRNTSVEDFFTDFKDEVRYTDQAGLIYVFTDAKQRGVRNKTHGDKIADLIEKERMGQVTRSRYRHNPNSGNVVRVFVWTLSAKARKEFGI